MSTRSSKPKSTAEKRPAEIQGGSAEKKLKPSDGRNDTDNSMLSNASAPPQSPAKQPTKPASAPPSPERPVVDFAVTGVQLPVGIVTLDGVPSSAIKVGTGTRLTVPVVSMCSHCPGNLGKIKRIINSYILMPSYSRLHNIFTLNPKDFQMVPVSKDKKPTKSWRIGMVGGDKAVSFYITGRVTNSALSLEGETKSISIQVIERFWPHIVLFLAMVLNIDFLLVPVKDDSICFSSFKQGSADWASSSKQPGRGGNGPDVRTWKVPVPIFDGHENFKLKEYWDLNLFCGGELTENSKALVIFTIRKFTSQAGMCVSLNIQSVVTIANRILTDWTHNPDPEWHKSLLDEKVLGVTCIVAYELQEEQVDDRSDTDDENGEDVGIL